MQKNILVVTPTLGNRPTLKRTVDSVRKIGGNQVKHIIIAPSKAIPNLQKEYTDIECISEPDNCRGIYPALNYAFNKYGHDYEYLTFINDDDYWLPEFKNLIDTLSKHPNIDFVYGRTRYVDENNNTIGTQTSSNQFKKFIPLLKSNIVLLTQQATIIKSNLFFKVGGFDENYKLAADTKLWAEISLLNITFKYINKVCAAYMVQKEQLSSDNVKQKSEHIRLINEYIHIKKSLSSVLQYRISNIFIYVKRLFNQKGYINNPLSRNHN